MYVCVCVCACVCVCVCNKKKRIYEHTRDLEIKGT